MGGEPSGCMNSTPHQTVLPKMTRAKPALMAEGPAAVRSLCCICVSAGHPLRPQRLPLDPAGAESDSTLGPGGQESVPERCRVHLGTHRTRAAEARARG